MEIGSFLGCDLSFLDESCSISLSKNAEEAVKKKALVIHLKKQGKGAVSNFRCEVNAVSGRITIYVAGSGSSVYFGHDVKGQYHVRIWRKSTLSIGGGTTSNGAKLILDNSEVSLGRDCMLSSDITIQAGDQHALVDLGNGCIVNAGLSEINIEDHVWLGRGCVILKGSYIGAGGVVGAGSIVTNEVPSYCISAGVPAKVVREGVTWSRYADKLDEFSKLAVSRE